MIELAPNARAFIFKRKQKSDPSEGCAAWGFLSGIARATCSVSFGGIGMILEVGFLDHPKTLELIEATKDPASPLLLIRLWEYCQIHKKWRFENMRDSFLAHVCRWTENPRVLRDTLLRIGFIKFDNDILIVHDWEKVNKSLINSWNNGAKGGRPVSYKLKPKRNPRVTGGLTRGCNPHHLILSNLKSTEVRTKFEEWITFRKGLKAVKNWDALFNEQITWLKRFSDSEKIEVLSQSIRNGWQGLFPIQSKNGHQKPERVTYKPNYLPPKREITDAEFQQQQKWAKEGASKLREELNKPCSRSPE